MPNPVALGYDNARSQSPSFTWHIDMAAVVTALAVNMKITPLYNLQKFENDSFRETAQKFFLAKQILSVAEAHKISSYFGKNYYWQRISIFL